MSWPSGYCDACKKPYDYKYSWGYEKPHGLEKVGQQWVCDNCKKNLLKKTIGGKERWLRNWIVANGGC